MTLDLHVMNGSLLVVAVVHQVASLINFDGCQLLQHYQNSCFSFLFCFVCNLSMCSRYLDEFSLTAL